MFDKSGYEDLSFLKEYDFSSRHILVVDDNDINREIAGEFLMLTGAEVEYAEDGKEAAEKFESFPEGYFDLILMDINMPEMNGYEATRKIRSAGSPYSRDIPIIAITSNTYADDVVKALDAGMNEHMEKPIDMERLDKVLKKWMDR